MIEVRGLTKEYRNKVALNGASFCIEDKAIVGLVGNNGAGKTTLINCLTGYISADFGKIIVDGVESSALSTYSSILVGEEMPFDPLLSLKKIMKRLSLFSYKFDYEQCEAIAKEFNLPLTKKYSNLSSGMKCQFKIAVGMATRRDIVIYDEPVSGLDESSRDKFYNLLLKDYLENPRVIIISTHLLAEIQNITEKLIIVRDGKIVCCDDTDNVRKKFVELTGKTELLSPFLLGRNVYKKEELGYLTSCVILNRMTKNELKYIRECDITYSLVKANTACKILCNDDCSNTLLEDNLDEVSSHGKYYAIGENNVEYLLENKSTCHTHIPTPNTEAGEYDE